MENLALKYRPTDFESIVGQESTVQALNRYIDKSREIGHLFHQVFLFSGERGTGKTTCARILSKALNCRQGPISKPCGVCDVCLSPVMDIVEWNAAANSSVGDVRELKQKVKSSPSLVKYRIYILDEIHMFSVQAFDSLLKLLEEPPKHAIFILATTELDKIPETIKSRVQIYKFNLISEDKIKSRLERICQLENLQIQGDCLSYIAKAGKGSLRDSITILSRVLSIVDGTVPLMDVILTQLGYVSKEQIETLLHFVLLKDRSRILDYIGSLDQAGVEWFSLWDDLILALKNHIEGHFLGEDVSKYSDILQTLIKRRIDLTLSSNPRIIIELTLASL